MSHRLVSTLRPQTPFRNITCPRLSGHWPLIRCRHCYSWEGYCHCAVSSGSDCILSHGCWSEHIRFQNKIFQSFAWPFVLYPHQQQNFLQLHHFKCLDSASQQSGHFRGEVKLHVDWVWRWFLQLKTLRSCDEINLGLKLRIYRARCPLSPYIRMRNLRIKSWQWK